MDAMSAQVRGPSRRGGAGIREAVHPCEHPVLGVLLRQQLSEQHAGRRRPSPAVNMSRDDREPEQRRRANGSAADMAHVPSTANATCVRRRQRAESRVDDGAGHEQLERVGRNAEQVEEKRNRRVEVAGDVNSPVAPDRGYRWWYAVPRTNPRTERS